MTFNGSGGGLPPDVDSLPVALARLTDAGSIVGKARIFVGKWVSMLAMSFCPLSRTISFSAKRKSRQVMVFLFGGDISKRHALGGSLNNCIRFKSVLFSEDGTQILYAVYFHVNRIASVLHVLFMSYPTAVFRGIRTIILNAVNFVSKRAWRHVGNKCLERIVQAFTDGNSPAPVVFERRRVGIVASLFHIQPNGIERVWIFKWHNLNPFTVVTA